MKKLFTLLAAVLLSSIAAAQVDETFVFTDMDGNPVPDGTTLVVKTINDQGQMVIPLKVKNNSAQVAFGAVYENIDAIPNGGWQTCVFGMCLNPTASGLSNKGLSLAGSVQDLETEWMPAAGSYATWTATLQLRVFQTTQGVLGPTAGPEIAQGATVNVRFEYSETSGVSGVKADRNGTAAATYYTVDGRRTATAPHGLAIVKRQDGSVVKQVVK